MKEKELLRLKNQLKRYIRRHYHPEPESDEYLGYGGPWPLDAAEKPMQDLSATAELPKELFSSANSLTDSAADASVPSEPAARTECCEAAALKYEAAEEDLQNDYSGYYGWGDDFPEAKAPREALGKCEAEPKEAKRKTGVSLPSLGFSAKKAAAKYELDEGFGEAVRRLIREKGLSTGDFYMRANVNTAWLSNVVKNNVTPKKEQALACCIGLGLNREEADGLLKKAGYALSESNLRDVIVSYFIEHRVYDIDLINAELFDYDLVPLGQSMK